MMKIAIISSHGPTLVRFRGDLVKEISSSGHKVIAYAPPVSPDLLEEIESLGAVYVSYPLDRTSINPLKDWKSYSALKKLLAKDTPDIVLSYTAKPMVYGSLAAANAGVGRIVSLVTGLGYGFVGGGVKPRIIRNVQKLLYRNAFRENARVVFQNPDDRDLFVDWDLVNRDKTEVVGGSGVNLKEFAFSAMPQGEPFVFLMVARLLKEKGVFEYLEAARIVNGEFPGRCRFRIVGGEDKNPGGLNLTKLKAIESPVEFMGFQADVKACIKDAHCFVLPSYREGTPRSILEALAVGRPVITTDTAGCRETVVRGENGWMVDVGDAEGLAQAMREALKMSPEKLESFSRSSREMAEDQFDVKKVNAKMTGILLDSTFDEEVY